MILLTSLLCCDCQECNTLRCSRWKTKRHATRHYPSYKRLTFPWQWQYLCPDKESQLALRSSSNQAPQMLYQFYLSYSWHREFGSPDIPGVDLHLLSLHSCYHCWNQIISARQIHIATQWTQWLNRQAWDMVGHGGTLDSRCDKHRESAPVGRGAGAGSAQWSDHFGKPAERFQMHCACGPLPSSGYSGNEHGWEAMVWPKTKTMDTGYLGRVEGILLTMQLSYLQRYPEPPGLSKSLPAAPSGQVEESDLKSASQPGAESTRLTTLRISTASPHSSTWSSHHRHTNHQLPHQLHHNLHLRPHHFHHLLLLLLHHHHHHHQRQ